MKNIGIKWNDGHFKVDQKSIGEMRLQSEDINQKPPPTVDPGHFKKKEKKRKKKADIFIGCSNSHPTRRRGFLSFFTVWLFGALLRLWRDRLTRIRPRGSPWCTTPVSYHKDVMGNQFGQETKEEEEEEEEEAWKTRGRLGPSSHKAWRSAPFFGFTSSELVQWFFKFGFLKWTRRLGFPRRVTRQEEVHSLAR